MCNVYGGSQLKKETGTEREKWRTWGTLNNRASAPAEDIRARVKWNFCAFDSLDKSITETTVVKKTRVILMSNTFKIDIDFLINGLSISMSTVENENSFFLFFFYFVIFSLSSDFIFPFWERITRESN